MEHEHVLKSVFGRKNPEHAALFERPRPGNLLKIIEDEELKKLNKIIPPFNIGDTLKITTKSEIITHLGEEKSKGKTVKSTFHSVFEGFLIGRRRAGLRSSIKILRVVSGDRVLMHLPLYAPEVSKIEVIRSGRIRRAKLYYLLKDKRNRKIRIREREAHGAAAAVMQLKNQNIEEN
jgi:large subunit ribosomal protein L19